MGVGQLDEDQEEVCGLTDLLRHGLPLIDRIERKQEKRDPTNEVYLRSSLSIENPVLTHRPLKGLGLYGIHRGSSERTPKVPIKSVETPSDLIVNRTYENEVLLSLNLLQ